MYKFMYKLYKLDSKYFLFNLILLFIAGTLEALSVFSIAPVVDLFIGNSENLGKISVYSKKIFSYFSVDMNKKNVIILLVSLIILKSIFIFIQKYVSLRSKYLILKKLTVEAFDGFFKGGLLFFSSVKKGVLLNSFNKEINQIGNSFFTFIGILSSLFRFLFFSVPPFFISWQLTLIVIAFLVLAYLPSVFLNRYSYRLGVKNTQTANTLQVRIVEFFDAAKIILGYGAAKKAIGDLDDAYNTHVRVTIPFQMIAQAVPLVYEPLMFVSLVGILYLSFDIFNLQVSSIVIVVYALRSALPLIINVIAEKNTIIGSIPSFEQLERLNAEAKQFVKSNGQVKLEDELKEISISNVSFCFPKTEVLVLKNICLKIKKGEKIGIAGLSGGGKTTLADIIMGLYPPTAGTVRVNGIDLNNLDLSDYRKKLSYVSQDPYLFNMSLSDNIRFLSDNVNQEDIEKACEQANVSQLLRKYAFKEVGDRGGNLSGGERQRVCLARALARKPEILVLDEVTSSLDSYSENIISDFLDSNYGNLTIITIAHRISTLKHSDRILMLKDGQIVEEGTFDELINKRSEFYFLNQYQLSGS